MLKFGLSNQKGGVAKTTNTINLAGAAADRGYDVLALDADPQGYLTQNLGLSAAYKDNLDGVGNAHDAWSDPTNYDPTEFIVEHPEFDVFPANIEMFTLEKDLISSGKSPIKRLSMIFDEIPDDKYDFAFVDAPPSLGPINDNVLLATRKLIVPMTANEESLMAFDHLDTQIRSTVNFYDDVSISIEGVVISNVEYPLDNEQEDSIAWIQDKFHEQCPIYEIRNRAVISRALKNHRSLFGYKEEACDQREVYEAMLDNIETKFL